MKKKIILVAAVVALAVLCIALFQNSDGQNEATQAAMQSAETDRQSAEAIVSSEETNGPSTEVNGQTEGANGQSEGIRPTSVYEDGMFTFTAGEFRERYVETLPEGYTLADTFVANASLNDKMQIDILDATGTATDLAIMLDVQESDLPCRQMALIIKEDCYEEDVAAMLEWYLTTFLDGFDGEEQTAIYEDYLDMFHTGAEDYRLHAGDDLVAMMNRAAEKSGNYYYAMISVQ